MPAWITIWCQRPVALDRERLAKLVAAPYYTDLIEAAGLDEEASEVLIEEMTVSDEMGLEVCFPGLRPIHVHDAADAQGVAEARVDLAEQM